MKRRGNWLAALPTVIAVGWWVIDKLAPDLLPPVPRPLGLAMVTLALVVVVAAFALQASHRIRRRTPGPWLAQPVWRSLRWVRQRPSVSILTAAPKAEFGSSTLDGLTISLTLHRSVLRAPKPTTIRFDTALLTLVQRHRGERRTWLLRPVETRGLLSLPLAPGASNSVIVAFNLISLPLASAHAPDLHSAYLLELDGVWATISGRHPITGRLPKVAYSMAPM